MMTAKKRSEPVEWRREITARLAATGYDVYYPNVSFFDQLTDRLFPPMPTVRLIAISARDDGRRDVWLETWTRPRKDQDWVILERYQCHDFAQIQEIVNEN